MWNWLKQLLSAGTQDNQDGNEPRRLKTQLQELCLELKAKEETIDRLKQELKQQRTLEENTITSRINAQTEVLVKTLATPAAQLMVQSHLSEVEGKDVKAKDILLVSKRLIAAFTETGLAFKGDIGQPADFDANQHEMIGPKAAAAGDQVIVRTPAVLFAERVIKKAGVTRDEP